MPFGYELIIDLKNCNTEKFTREHIKQYFITITDKDHIDMVREDLHFWDYLDTPQDEIPYDQPHLVGITAIQFIKTSNITLHTLDMLAELYINIFSCNPFDMDIAKSYTAEFFMGEITKYTILERGDRK